jgi:5-(carboxyamino)imidazole ribonucleotide synthase
MSTSSRLILPGATLGVLGGGQLGRMFTMAARTMGYRVIVFDPDPACGAGMLADEHIRADYADEHALEKMAVQCDAITLEFENIPSGTVRFLADRAAVFPDAESLEIAQNRDLEKQFAQKAGLQPVPYYAVADVADLEPAANEVGFPAILKSNTLGYDGKGQYPVENFDALCAAFDQSGRVECVLEKKIDIACEISSIVARNADCDIQCFPVSENLHRNGILHMSIVPARVAPPIAQNAVEYASLLADAMEYIGILAVEFFVSQDGTLYFNEMAPRPHNSGHYTKDACVTSQFEQQVRMMCGLPPGDTRLLSPVVMVNMLGDLWPPDWRAILEQENIKLHLYGKSEARVGRKMGHYNVLANNVDDALETAEQVFAQLSQHS